MGLECQGAQAGHASSQTVPERMNSYPLTDPECRESGEIWPIPM